MLLLSGLARLRVEAGALVCARALTAGVFTELFLAVSQNTKPQNIFILHAKEVHLVALHEYREG
jgi:hypothetical protein